MRKPLKTTTPPTQHRRPRALERAFSLVEVMITVLILAILAAIVMPRVESATTESHATSLQTTVASVQRKIIDRRSTGVAWPAEIKADWFAGNHLPRNSFDPTHTSPIEVDATAAPDIHHPAVKFITADGAFWYNPGTGDFRARIPDQGDDSKNLALYNRVNNCELDTW